MSSTSLAPRFLRLQIPATAFFGLALCGLGACASNATGQSSRYPGARFDQAQPSVQPASSTASASSPIELPPAPPGSSILPEAEAAFARGNALEAAGRYQAAAATASPAQAADFRMRAAEAATLGGDPARADLILDQIPAPPLDPRQQARYRLLRAKTAIARNDPTRALRLLPTGDPGGDPASAAALLAVRATALTRVGDILGATQSRVQRERYLTPGAAISENREALWVALNSVPLDAATLGRASQAMPVVRGWVELAALARRAAPLQDYDLWRKRYPGHPGEERLASLYAQGTPAAGVGSTATLPPSSGATTAGTFSTIAAGSGGIGLLLPESGPLIAIGGAVHTGFDAAASQAGAAPGRGYDSAGGVPTAYQRALSESPGVLVGPLRKEDVAALAQGGNGSVPQLALNYLDAGRPVPPGFYQFGLAPEDEARASAEDAFARGLQRAIAMVPSGDWGNRVLGAFEQRMRELGGQVVESGRYTGDPQNWSDPVRRLLRYVTIDDKKKAAEARAKVGPGVDPQRRNDIDFVFIAGRSSQARVLWPLFRYYHADRLPIYATAAAFDGTGDSDLSGIRFCDSPWLLENGGPLSTLATEARSGRSLDNARLYAMGNDAFLLANRIAQNQLHPGDEIAGATGVLRVDTSGAIHRGLICAQMTSGQPFVLSAPSVLP